jgi:hypothetical protein
MPGQTGDVRISLLGRRYANGPFITIFTFWFNVGFVDHSPMVWDLACFDNVQPAPTRALPARWHRRAGSIVRVTRHTGAGESGVAAAPARRLPRADAVGGQAACRLLAVQDLTSSDLLLGLRGPVHVGGGVAERACAKEGIGRQRRARRHALRAPAPLPPARRRGLCALPGPAQPQRRGSYSQPTRVGATMSLCVGPGC